MKLKYHFYRNLQKVLSLVPEKTVRSLMRTINKELVFGCSEEVKKEMEKRANYALTDFLSLAKDIPHLITPEKYPHNDFYYNALILKKYADIEENDFIRAAMEHAVYIADDYFWDCDVNSEFDNIIVNSNPRKEVLSKVTDKNIFVVGPYIAYAENLLSEEEIEKEKKRLGKNLLVFPMHSTHWIDVDYNIDGFVKKIQKIGEKFDSIRVCMYWKDILRGNYKQYQNAGFEIVCAGHIYEPNFLPRLKSIIEISDYTLSNQIGSQIGFSIYLNKPHHLINDDYSHTIRLSSLKEDTEDRKKKAQNGNNVNRIYEVFAKFSDVITDEQRQVIDKYWGISEVKSKEELRELLLKLKD